jgi:hypothetical protein
MMFVFIGELTNWPDKIVSRNRALREIKSTVEEHNAK